MYEQKSYTVSENTGYNKTRLQEQFGMVEEAQRKFREASAEIAEHEGT